MEEIHKSYLKTDKISFVNSLQFKFRTSVHTVEFDTKRSKQYL